MAQRGSASRHRDGETVCSGSSAHVIRVSGDTNGETCAELDLALDVVYNGGGRQVAVEILEPKTVEVALDVLMLHLARFRARGGDVVIACADEPVVTSDLRVERRIDDAIASLLR
jgi:hypothetical protein